MTTDAGRTAPQDASSGRGYHVTSMLHVVDVELGGQWLVWKGLIFRLALGCALTAYSQTDIGPNFQPRAPALSEQFAQAGERHLDDTYRRYVFTPTVSFAVGWRFFPWLRRGRWSRKPHPLMSRTLGGGSAAGPPSASTDRLDAPSRRLGAKKKPRRRARSSRERQDPSQGSCVRGSGEPPAAPCRPVCRR